MTDLPLPFEIDGPTLLIVRHGQTEHNASGIYQGHTNTELSERGLRQAEVAAGKLALRRPIRIVSSDLFRALSTADALRVKTGVDVEIEPGLREIDVGTWAGLKHAEVEKRYPVESGAIRAGRDARRGEHGETLAEVGARTALVFHRVAATLAPHECAVLVSHGMAARLMTAAVVGWSVSDAAERLPVLDNCHWAEVTWRRDGWAVVGWNLGDAVTETS
ncbi:MAG: histidine phosphatase family protein [Ornithinimicrobium sp.]